jgi:HD-GYP domain-containing protein (c-di-GMP phosphodiesterase class II)
MHHHERWDGRGYPLGLKGEAIPLGARILAVCDSYDAMLTEKRHRKARNATEATRELARCSGSQFDPKVVEAFIAQLTLAS